MIYLKLFFEFFKTGLFAIGGGLATIPFLKDIGLRTGWFTMEELTNMIAISESTPGPTGINMATYVGFACAGPLGSLIATLGIVTPSVIIIILISKAIYKYKDSPYVSSGMTGIRACSIGMITYAVLSIVSTTLFSFGLFKETGNILNLFQFKAFIIFIGIYLLTKKVKLHPAFYLIIAAIVGIFIYM